VVGTWERISNGVQYSLVDCPDGFSMVHADQHDLQQCLRCNVNRQYILRPSVDECQDCPPGLVCYGNQEFDVVTPSSVWEQDDGIMRLISCPSGHRVYDGTSRWNGSLLSKDDGVFDATVQRCEVCPAGTECTNGTCTECTPCPAGSWKDDAGAHACRKCPINTFNPHIGKTSQSDCLPCMADSTTLGATGSHQETDCACQDRFYRLQNDTSDVGYTCRVCPPGGMCEARTLRPNQAVLDAAAEVVEQVCAFRDAMKPEDFRCDVLGEWFRDSSNGNAWALRSCPKGTQMIDHEMCDPCRKCDRGVWCRTAQYIVDSNTHRCQDCPLGAECDGASLRSIHGLSDKGAIWRADLMGLYRLLKCPVGHQLRNMSSIASSGVNIDYMDQECVPCPPGYYILSSEVREIRVDVKIPRHLVFGAYDSSSTLPACQQFQRNYSHS